MKKSVWIIVIIILALAYWWYSQSAPAGVDNLPPSGAAVGLVTGVTREFTITGSDFSFSPVEMSVNEGDRVKIVFNNAKGFHDLKIDEFNVGTKQLKEGESETIEFVADKAGTYEYYCSVGNHRAMGMKGIFTVLTTTPTAQ